MYIVQLLKQIPITRRIILKIKERKFLKLNSYENMSNGIVNIDYNDKCRSNKIVIGKECRLDLPTIRIRGSHNTIIIEDGVYMGKQCSFWMEGDGINIVIGKNTSFTRLCHFCAQENDVSIIVGEDCMFSNKIIVRTSDSHPIYDLNTKERLNPAKSVKIGSRVWIAPDSKIMKGAEIGDGSIVGSNTMISKTYPSNCLIVGMPGRIVKENIYWTREALF